MNYEVERIKELCRKRGWSQYRLAKEMGESNGRINTMLKGKSVPSSSTLRRVCSAFNITMSAFYAEDGIPATLTEDQNSVLQNYTLLDSYHRALAAAYIKGLSDGSCGIGDLDQEGGKEAKH